MTQIFSPPGTDTSQQILCCYCNDTEQTIIARITNLNQRDCERVIFPKECFFFNVPPDAKLEIYRQSIIGVIEDVIPCVELQTS
ncbi:Domain of unknown function DUF1830 [Gloeothece citriformis PCC 7424]|uniref:DUF1830 domain-containing protein n=1 Tax=Gloeothece citriformis (strain PCC 7424) TaxID=65393 RepID=B7K898_GLOC7|nr:DUF1830 domain-containing protein [Gloeothece citriformis]ACK69858.1 Domain of unknown function DUF1830 [Gloeothece citriformis PCC 7424]